MGGVMGGLVAIACPAWGPGSAAATSTSTCTYTSAARTVAVTLASFRGTLIRAGNAIDFDGAPCGSATVSNTDRITVTATVLGEMIIDLRGGPFVNPNLPGEIPMSVDLGPTPGDLTIVGSAGADSIRFGTGGINLDAGSHGGVDVTVVSVQRFAVSAGGGDDVVSAAGGDGTGAELPGTIPISMDGGPGNDTLVGGAAGDLIGGPGDDTLDGRGGQATADYSRDTSPVTVDLATGAATDGSGGHDTLTGIENAAGDAGATLIGDGNANVLTGDGATSTLAGAGDDVVQGDAGAVDGGAGTDTYRCMTDSDSITVDLATGTTDGCGTATLAGIENVTANTSCDMDTGCPVVIVGNDGDNVLVAGACNCLATISGGGGADTLVGTFFVNGPRPGDVLDGGPGNDVIFGLWGDDRLIGGPGADTIFGGKGADRLFGLDGRDTLVGGLGADVVRGGRGADDLFGRRGPDHLYGGFGNDHLNGGRGLDTCRGGPGADTLTGCE